MTKLSWLRALVFLLAAGGGLLSGCQTTGADVSSAQKRAEHRHHYGQ